jgi:hypothetical protein
MSRQQRTDEDTARVLAAAGITVTEEGRARARARLAEADARMTEEKRQDLRQRLRRYSEHP